MYGDTGEFDERFDINLEIQKQWLYNGTDNIAHLDSDRGIHIYGDYGIASTKPVSKIKLNVSNEMYRNYLDYHTSV